MNGHLKVKVGVVSICMHAYGKCVLHSLLIGT